MGLNDLPLFSTAVYLIGGTLSFFICAFVYLSYRRSHHQELLHTAIIFFALAIHAYAFAAPFLAHTPTPAAMGWGYIIGMGFVYWVSLFAIPVMLFLSPIRSLERFANPFIALVTLLGIISLSTMIIDFRSPLSSELGFVLWNINPLSAWINGLTGFTVGTLWFFSYYSNSKRIGDRILKRKMLLMGSIGLLLGFVALTVYTSHSGLQTAIGHTFFLLSCIAGLAIYLPKRESARSF